MQVFDRFDEVRLAELVSAGLSMRTVVSSIRYLLRFTEDERIGANIESACTDPDQRQARLLSQRHRQQLTLRARAAW